MPARKRYSHRHYADPAMLPKLAVAGRLDADSSGLLLLTQDGALVRSIIAEDSELEKECVGTACVPDCVTALRCDT